MQLRGYSRLCYILVIAIFMVSYATCSQTSEGENLPDASPSNRSSSSRDSWSKIANCLKNKLGGRAVNRNVRCAAREMYAVYRSMDLISCKSCDLYFFCTANYNAVYDCDRHSNAKKAAHAISECRDIRSSDGTDESILQASEFGRNGGNCGNMYLCSSGCRFNPVDETCSPAKCR